MLSIWNSLKFCCLAKGLIPFPKAWLIYIIATEFLFKPVNSFRIKDSSFTSYQTTNQNSLSLSQTTNFRFFQTDRVTTVLNLMKMADSSPLG